jgi:hypothetical protein
MIELLSTLVAATLCLTASVASLPASGLSTCPPTPKVRQ